MASTVGNAFRSERLVYRAMENTDADKEWFHTQLQCDPEAFALSDPNIMRPQLKSNSDEGWTDMSKGLLGVVICLPSSSSTSQPDGPKPEAERIGILTLDDRAGGSGYKHHHRNTLLGICIAKAHQNKGYGREVLDWAVDWAFTRANVHSVSLGCVEYNERGRHLYEKVGFVLEGRLRERHFHERKWWDVFIYSMLESDWETMRGGGGEKS